MTVRRFPKKRGAPPLKPCCGQCGRELTGREAQERDHDYQHELQTGVSLNLRLLAESSNPHKIGFVTLRLSSERVSLGWAEEPHYDMEWDDLMTLLKRWEQEGCEIVRPRPELAEDEHHAPRLA